MKSYFKKISYIFAVSISLFIMHGVYTMISHNLTPVTHDHDILTLTPFTQSERISIELAQRHEQFMKHPMIVLNSPQVSADIAQEHVLNIKN